MRVSDTPRGRFAPSPTGELHPGSLLAALGSWLMARHAGGEWIVRIEDLDPPREVAGAAERQVGTLGAFGLVSDAPVVRQSARHRLYQDALDELLRRGLAYPCACSRSDLAATGGIHGPRCVRVAGTVRRMAVRLRVNPGEVVEFDDLIRGRISQDVGREVGDFVLLRADGLWAYQLAVVVDDAAQGVTQVVRGADLLDSTARQILLQRALDLPTPVYAHLPLLVDTAGRKLSKSDGSIPIDPNAPLPALAQAWRRLGQDSAVGREAASPAEWLDAARQAFDPRLVPSADVAATLPEASMPRIG